MPRKTGVYKNIAFMVTNEQYDLVKAEAERLGLDLADYARRCLRDSTPGFEDAPDIPKRGSYYRVQTTTERLQELAGDSGKIELGWHNEQHGFWLVQDGQYTFLAKDGIHALRKLRELIQIEEDQHTEPAHRPSSA